MTSMAKMSRLWALVDSQWPVADPRNVALRAEHAALVTAWLSGARQKQCVTRYWGSKKRMMLAGFFRSRLEWRLRLRLLPPLCPRQSHECLSQLPQTWRSRQLLGSENKASNTGIADQEIP
jgi:hypothetical protein